MENVNDDRYFESKTKRKNLLLIVKRIIK